MSEEHSVAMSDHSVAELAGEPAAIRLTGQVPELGTEVLMAWDGLEFAVTYETRSISSAIGAAQRRYPDATVLQSRRVVTVQQYAKPRRDGDDDSPCRELEALGEIASP